MRWGNCLWKRVGESKENLSMESDRLKDERRALKISFALEKTMGPLVFCLFLLTLFLLDGKSSGARMISPRRSLTAPRGGAMALYLEKGRK